MFISTPGYLSSTYLPHVYIDGSFLSLSLSSLDEGAIWHLLGFRSKFDFNTSCHSSRKGMFEEDSLQKAPRR